VPIPADDNPGGSCRTGIMGIQPRHLVDYHHHVIEAVQCILQPGSGLGVRCDVAPMPEKVTEKLGGIAKMLRAIRTSCRCSGGNSRIALPRFSTRPRSRSRHSAAKLDAGSVNRRNSGPGSAFTWPFISSGGRPGFWRHWRRDPAGSRPALQIGAQPSTTRLEHYGAPLPPFTGGARSADQMAISAAQI